jgi:glycosyltransferase involved in cell wall biosynthesis
MKSAFEPLTVVHISTQRTWHGGEGQAYLLMEGLRRRGHRVVAFARAGGELAQRAVASRFEVHTFRRRGRGPNSLWSMRRRLQAVAADVIHAHDGHAVTCAGIASLGLGIPIRVASRRVDFSVRSVGKYTWLSDVVIAISSAVADVCVDSGIHRSKLRIVHSGVDPARMDRGDRSAGRRALGLSDGETLLLTVAKLTDHKGHVYLLRALPEVIRRYGPVRLALAGEGELADSLAAEARSLGVAEHVMFLGYRDDVPDLVKAADLFVMPSHMEGLCTSLLDAMFAGVPIVTTGAGGIADAVGATDTAGPVSYLVPPRDSQALVNAIHQALVNRQETAKLVERAYRRAHTMFTHDCMVDGTLAVYHEMLTRRARRAA